MPQFGLPTIDPNVKDGEGLAYDLNSWSAALHSGHSGATRPSYARAGMTWVNTASNPWRVYFFDGTDDILTGSVDIVTNTYTPAGSSGSGSIPGGVSDLTYSYTYGLGNMPTGNLLKITGGITAVDNAAEANEGEAVGVFVRDLRSCVTTGTAGNVNAGLFAHTVTRNGLQNQFEWNGLFILDMLSSGPGEHCALYTQANRYGTSGTWGACLQAVDYREEAENSGLLWGAEIDCAVTGRRTNAMGISVVAQDAKEVTGRGSSADKRAGVGIGIGSSGGAKWELGQRITDFCVEGLLIYPGPTYSYTGVIAENGVRIQGDYSRSGVVVRYTNAPIGIDLAEGNVFSNTAIALAENHSIKFGANKLSTVSNVLLWNDVPVGGGGGSGSSVITVGTTPLFAGLGGDLNIPMLTIPAGKQLYFDKEATGADFSSIYLNKNLTNATGGGAQIGRGHFVNVTTGSGYAGSELGIDVLITSNSQWSASNSPNHVGYNLEINKQGSAGVYGHNTILRDTSNNPNGALVGNSLTLLSGGTDPYGSRTGMLIAVGKTPSATNTSVTRGLWFAGTVGQAWFDKVIQVSTPIMNSAFLYEGSSAVGSESTSAIIRSTGSAYIGINLVNSAHSSGIALNLAANDAVAVNGTPVLKRQAGGWCKVIGSTSTYRNYFGGDFNLNTVNTSFVLADAGNLQGHVIALYRVLYTLINDYRFHGSIGGNPNSSANASFQVPPT